MKQSEVMRLPNGKHQAGDGLRLIVRGDSRIWMLRIQHNGRRVERSLGSAYELTLAMAKIKSEELANAIRSGNDPKEIAAQEAKKKDRMSQDITVEQIAPIAIERKAAVARWKNKRSREHLESITKRYIIAAIGKKPVKDVSRDDVLGILEPIWQIKSDISKRCRMALELIMNVAITEGVRDDNPARWKANLDLFLPSHTKTNPTKHLTAVTLAEAQQVARAFWEKKDLVGLAILFGMMTATRISEFCEAKWNEIDIATATWEIPLERRKDGKQYPHRVPLSSQALAILQVLPRKNEYLFPGRGGGHIHKESPRNVLSRAVGRPVTMHGCRSTFRDWCAVEGVDFALAEISLMHSIGNAVTQAYLRSDLLEKRRPIMQKWSNVLLKISK